MPDQPPAGGVAAVKDENEAWLLAIDGVQGVAVGRDDAGRDAVLVYVLDAEVTAGLPRQIEGFPVVTVVTGEIRPLG